MTQEHEHANVEKNLPSKGPIQAARWSTRWQWNKSNIYWKRWPLRLLLPTYKTWRRGQWSQSYLQCVLWEWLRLEDIHYWPGSDREGLQSTALVLGLFGCPIPLYLFDYLQHKAPFNQTGNKCFLMCLWVPELQRRDREREPMRPRKKKKKDREGCNNAGCTVAIQPPSPSYIVWCELVVTRWGQRGQWHHGNWGVDEKWQVFPNNSVPFPWHGFFSSLFSHFSRVLLFLHPPRDLIRQISARKPEVGFHVWRLAYKPIRRLPSDFWPLRGNAGGREARRGSRRGFGVTWVMISHVKEKKNVLRLHYIIRHNVACTSFLWNHPG